MRTATFILDKSFLLVTAIVVGLILFGLVVFLRGYLQLPGNWDLFVGGSLVYTTTALYLLFKTGPFAFVKGTAQRLLFIIVVELPVVVFFLVFYFGMVPLPRSILPYTLASVLLAPVAVLGVDLCFKWWTRKL
jgi:hypothetical protein